MKMDSESEPTTTPPSDINSNKSNEEPSSLSENNNIAGEDVSDSVAMSTTSQTKSPSTADEDDQVSQEHESSLADIKSTDDVIDRDTEESGVTRDDNVIDKDEAERPQEDASSEQAGDSNDKTSDVILTDEIVSKLKESADEHCSISNKDDASVETQEDDKKTDVVNEKIDEVVPEEDAEDIKDEIIGDNNESWNKMHLTEDVSEGNQVQPSSPGHHASASSSPSATNLTSSASNKSIQQNGVDSSKNAAPMVIKTIEEFETNNTSTSANVVTNGNDHAGIINEDDEEFVNCNKTEQIVLEDKSPEYHQSAEEPITVLPPKRRMSQSSGGDQITAGQSSSKRMKISTLENTDFQTRDQILNNYMENMESTGFDGLKKHSEQLLLEIQKLGEVAKVKEREWNQILHQKKLREELLLRLQRAKQIMVLQTNGNTNPKHQDQLLQRYQQQQLNQRQQQTYQQQDMADKGRQGPLVDVQKLILDYRQTHPESIPRRGRRIRGQDGQQRYDSGNLLTMSNVALGSGSQVRTSSSSSSSSVANINQDIYNEFSLLLSSLDNDRLKTASSSSIKELLAQFARMSPSERQDLLNSVKGPHNVTGQATTYPEVTVHAVQQQQAAALQLAPSASNSLLHGILTKPTKSSSTTSTTSTTGTAKDTTGTKQSFSPTLARLLTAPEQRPAASGPNHLKNHHKSTNSSNASPSPCSSSNTSSLNNNHKSVSVSDLILSSTKARNEITITPVQQFEEHSKSSLHHQDEEADDSADRLVIDEGDSHAGRIKQMEEEAAEEVPQCQGCNHKAAQFVCAGCGNQWYCSRECQVSAWDEHSEVCSG